MLLVTICCIWMEDVEEISSLGFDSGSNALFTDLHVHLCIGYLYAHLSYYLSLT